VDCPTTPPFASILLFLLSVSIYNTTAELGTFSHEISNGFWTCELVFHS
jgi:hypothetical protein